MAKAQDRTLLNIVEYRFESTKMATGPNELQSVATWSIAPSQVNIPLRIAALLRISDVQVSRKNEAVHSSPVSSPYLQLR